MEKIIVFLITDPKLTGKSAQKQEGIVTQLFKKQKIILLFGTFKMGPLKFK